MSLSAMLRARKPTASRPGVSAGTAGGFRASRPRSARVRLSQSPPPASQASPRDPARRRAAEPDARLSAEQRRVLELVLAGRSVFFTGSAGTGKSLLLREIVAALARAGKRRSTFVTASTGVAAVNVGGSTIHSFAGIGLGKDSVMDTLRRVRRQHKTRRRWQAAEVLIVDEVSMLDGGALDLIDAVGRDCRGSRLPFGGLQVVLCGDFFQLPPVGLDSRGASFAFEAKVWAEAVQESVVLSSVFRQRDSAFVDMLNECRSGALSDATKAALLGASAGAAPPPPAGIERTQLFTTNDRVDLLNEGRLRQLRGAGVTFGARDSGPSESHLHVLRKILELRVGAQVMLLKNLHTDSGLVNGARGAVVGFLGADEARRRFGADHEGATDNELPHGMAIGDPQLPLVHFEGAGEVVIGRAAWEMEETGQLMASRRQVPLRLAWGMSIHKAQGMTIPHLEVHLSRVFEYGQIYVALSRATSMDGLVIHNFDPAKVRAHPRVKAFYAELRQAMAEGRPPASFYRGESAGAGAGAGAGAAPGPWISRRTAPGQPPAKAKLSDLLRSVGKGGYRNRHQQQRPPPAARAAAAAAPPPRATPLKRPNMGPQRTPGMSDEVWARVRGNYEEAMRRKRARQGMTS